MPIDFEAEKKQKLEFAARHGYSIKHDERHQLYRVYKKRLWLHADDAQVAMCNSEWDATHVAFSLALVAAGARLPDLRPDPLDQALNEGDGSYRP